jgi:hypothetical protein
MIELYMLRLEALRNIMATTDDFSDYLGAEFDMMCIEFDLLDELGLIPLD